MPQLCERWPAEHDGNERRSVERLGEQTSNTDRAVSFAGRVAVVGGSIPSSAGVLAERPSSRRDLPVPRAGLANAWPRRHRLLGMALRYARLVVTELDGGAGRLGRLGRARRHLSLCRGSSGGGAGGAVGCRQRLVFPRPGLAKPCHHFGLRGCNLVRIRFLCAAY